MVKVTQIPFPILQAMVYYQDEFDLTYGQLCRWLYRRHSIKMTAQGIRWTILAYRRENT